MQLVGQLLMQFNNMLLKIADEALYASKHGGRNRVTAIHPQAVKIIDQ